MPFNSKPRLNEVALVVNAIPVNATTKPYVYYLEMGLSVELYAGMRCPPGSFWEHFGLYFDLTHLFYKVTDANNNIYTQTATGSSAKGDAGASDNYAGVLGLNAGGSGGSAGKSPFIKCMGGYLPATATSIVPADGYMVLQTPLYGGIYVCSGSTMQTNPTPFPSPTPPATPFPNPSPTPTPPTSAVQFSHAVTIQGEGTHCPLRRRREQRAHVGNRAGLGQRELHQARSGNSSGTAGLRCMELHDRSRLSADERRHFHPQPRNC